MPTEKEAWRRHTVYYLRLMALSIEGKDVTNILWNEDNIRLALNNALQEIDDVKADLGAALKEGGD